MKALATIAAALLLAGCQHNPEFSRSMQQASDDFLRGRAESSRYLLEFRRARAASVARCRRTSHDEVTCTQGY